MLFVSSIFPLHLDTAHFSNITGEGDSHVWNLRRHLLEVWQFEVEEFIRHVTEQIHWWMVHDGSKDSHVTISKTCLAQVAQSRAPSGTRIKANTWKRRAGIFGLDKHVFGLETFGLVRPRHRRPSSGDCRAVQELAIGNTIGLDPQTLHTAQISRFSGS